jgi:beta-lactam-binding protein with PASTA domain
VSDGKPYVTVDNYMGQDKDVAKANAEKLGLKVTLTKEAAWCLTGTTVRTQSPDPQTQVEVGTGITLGYCF